MDVDKKTQAHTKSIGYGWAQSFNFLRDPITKLDHPPRKGPKNLKNEVAAGVYYL